MGCGGQGQPSTFVVGDFESGSLADWQAVSGGSGKWFVYTDGRKPPDPAHTDPNVPFNVPNPPQGKFGAVTDMNGPGTRILYRDFRLHGRFTLHLNVFYANAAPFKNPATLAYDVSESNQQFRIDLVLPSAPIDSVREADVLLNIFRTSEFALALRRPTPVNVDLSRWSGRTVRLRLAATDNGGPLRAGVDDIRLERIGTDTGARVELLDTQRPSRAIDLVLHRLTEADVLAALSAHDDELAGEDEFRRRARCTARKGSAREDLGPREPEDRHPQYDRDEVPHRLDEQDVHRGGNVTARREGSAGAGRPHRQASPRLPQ
jgi:hypothetical protein